MDYLSRREHSRYELYQKLSKHNFEKITAELLGRGVDDQLIYNSIDEVDDDEWLENAKTVLEKKLGNNQQLDYDNQLKLMKFLSNRGFTMDQIKTTVERFKKE